MSDSAKGPAAGYLYQFEKALLMLASQSNINNSVSIEYLDDVTAHDLNNNVIITLQAKHSIAVGSNTFEDTSYSLWRTLEIWIEKLEKNLFNNKTQFVCSTNKKIDTDSLLYKIQHEDYNVVENLIKELLEKQKTKLGEYEAKDPSTGTTIRAINKLIQNVIDNLNYFKIIKENLIIEDDENVKEAIFNELHLMSDQITDLQRDLFYESLYGWITGNSKAKWNQGKEAKFSKKDFDNKIQQIRSNPAIINAIFRTRQILGDIAEDQIEIKKGDLFAKQIEDFVGNRSVINRKIRKAIIEYIYSEVEISYIITSGNYTAQDFDEFLQECKNKWQDCYDNHIRKELEDYTEDEMNEIAVAIFNELMGDISIKFKDGFSFNSSNLYIKNGSLLKLSDIPEIGWHPNWEEKYKV